VTESKKVTMTSRQMRKLNTIGLHQPAQYTK